MFTCLQIGFKFILYCTFVSVCGISVGQIANPGIPVNPVEPGEPPNKPCTFRHEKPCPELDYLRCNMTEVDGAVEQWVDAGSAGFNTPVWCPTFTYLDCPVGLTESIPVDMDPEYIVLGGVGHGAKYINDGVAGPKVCFNNIACASTPEVSTWPDLGNCVACRIGPSAEEPFSDSAQESRCPMIAWCRGSIDPPPVVINAVELESWDNMVLDPDCDEYWGEPIVEVEDI